MKSQRRLQHYHRPYHEALARLADRPGTAIVAVHSFTPQLNGRPPRPWHIGILSNDDRRLSDPLLAELQNHTDVTTGDNVPYTGYLEGDTMDKHALPQNLLHTLIEVRNDLIAEESGQIKWAERLAPLIKTAISKATDI